MYQIFSRSLIQGDKASRKTSPTLLMRTNDFRDALRMLKLFKEDFPHVYMVRTNDGAEWDDGLWIVYK